MFTFINIDVLFAIFGQKDLMKREKLLMAYVVDDMAALPASVRLCPLYVSVACTGNSQLVDFEPFVGFNEQRSANDVSRPKHGQLILKSDFDIF